MDKKESFLKIGTLYTIATLFNKGISFITVPIFTRLLSTYEYGVVNTFTSWQSILSIVISMTLYMGIRAAFINYEKNVNEVMSTVVTFTLLLGMGGALLTMVLLHFFSFGVSYVMVICCFLQAFYSAIMSDYTVYLMMKYQYKLRTLLMILPEVLAAIASIIGIVFLYKSERFLGKIVPTTIVYMLFTLFMMFLVYKDAKPSINGKYLSFCLKISTPLILHGLSLYVLGQSDRLMITALRGASETGVYSLVYNFGMVATVITNALNGIWVPWYTEALKKRKIQEINLIAKDYAYLMAYAMVSLVLVAPEMLKILAPKEYWVGISIIPPIVLANFFVFLYTLYVNTEHFYQKTVFTSINSFIAAICNIGLNLMFIPVYGYRAAAYTTLVAYLVSLIMHAHYSKKLDALVYPIKEFRGSMTQILLVIPVFYLLVNMPIIRWGLMILYLLMAIIKQRKRIGIYFPKLTKYYFFN